MSYLMLDRRVTMDNSGSRTAYVTCEHCTGISKGWLARIRLAAYGSRWDLMRQFERREPPSRRDRHLHRYALTEPGVYEADSVLSVTDSTRQRCYFELSPQGEIAILASKEAAIERLVAIERGERTSAKAAGGTEQWKKANKSS